MLSKRGHQRAHEPMRVPMTLEQAAPQHSAEQTCLLDRLRCSLTAKLGMDGGESHPHSLQVPSVEVQVAAGFTDDHKLRGAISRGAKQTNPQASESNESGKQRRRQQEKAMSSRRRGREMDSRPRKSLRRQEERVHALTVAGELLVFENSYGKGHVITAMENCCFSIAAGNDRVESPVKLSSRV